MAPRLDRKGRNWCPLAVRTVHSRQVMVPLEAGTPVGRRTDQRIPAQDGMAEAHRADHESASGVTGCAAEKVLHPEPRNFRETFIDEARTACTLSCGRPGDVRTHPAAIGNQHTVASPARAAVVAFDASCSCGIVRIARAPSRPFKGGPNADIMAHHKHGCTLLRSHLHGLKCRRPTRNAAGGRCRPVSWRRGRRGRHPWFSRRRRRWRRRRAGLRRRTAGRGRR